MSGDPALREVAPTEQPEEAAEDSFVDLFARLIDDAERFVRAEIQLYRAQLFTRLKQGRIAIVMLAVAFSLGQASVIALLIGLFAMLRGTLGIVGATVAVVIGALGVAGLLARLAIGQLRALTKIRDGKP